MHGKRKRSSWKAYGSLAERLSVYCRLRPVVGYAMASLRQHSAAPVAGGSSRFCMQTDRVAEHLGDILFQIRGGNTGYAARVSPALAIHLLPMNECVVRRRSRPPPPLKYYCRQITSRSWESSTTWLSLNYIMLLYCPDFCRPACYRALYSCSVIVALENVVPEGVAFSVNMLIKLLLVFKWPCMYYLTQLK